MKKIWGKWKWNIVLIHHHHVSSCSSLCWWFSLATSYGAMTGNHTIPFMIYRFPVLQMYGEIAKRLRGVFQLRRQHARRQNEALLRCPENSPHQTRGQWWAVFPRHVQIQPYIRRQRLHRQIRIQKIRRWEFVSSTSRMFWSRCSKVVHMSNSSQLSVAWWDEIVFRHRMKTLNRVFEYWITKILHINENDR